MMVMRGFDHLFFCRKAKMVSAAILLFLLFFTGGFGREAIKAFENPDEREAASFAPKTWYKLVTAVIFIWGQQTGGDDTWSPARPGEGVFYEKHTGYSFEHVGEGTVTRVEMYPYTPQRLDLDDEDLAITGFGGSAGAYEEQFYRYGSRQIHLKNSAVSGNRISYTWEAELKANESLMDVTELMQTEAGLAIIRDDIMGGYVPQEMQAYLDSVKILGQDVGAYLLFVPYVIEYDVLPPGGTAPEEETDPPEEEEDIQKPQEIPISATAKLSLPQKAYLGHDILAEDESVIEYENQIYGAQRAYEMGLGSGSLRFPSENPSKRERLSPSRYLLSFENTGEKTVSLRLRLKDGSVLTDEKQIQILDTPHAQGYLSGSQKENRKQLLHISVAQNPQAPVKEIQVRLICEEKGEEVTLFHKALSGGKNEKANSDHIKTRPIEACPSDEEWIYCQLPFLTKFSEKVDMKWEILARDSLGKSSVASGSFQVLPDIPPDAQIKLEPVFYREKGSDTALISVEDVSVTDSDQLSRSWSFSFDKGKTFLPLEQIENWADLSFGSGKQVQIPKEGVGEVYVRLSVKDQWTEETLEEYVSQEDYLTDQAEGKTVVDNMAPYVSFTARKAQKADFLILPQTGKEEELAEKVKEEIQKRSKQKGFDSRVYIEALPGAGEKNHFQAQLRVDTPSGYQVNWTSYEDENFIVDNQRLYKLDATWEEGVTDAYPKGPYRISAWQVMGEENEKGKEEPLWSFPFDEQLLDPSGTGEGSFYFGQDDQGLYLFLVCQGKTLVLEKEKGNLLAVLPFTVGRENYVYDQAIYSMTQEGILKISLLDGKKEIISQDPVQGSTRRFQGRIHYLTQDGSIPYMCFFDPLSGQKGRYALEESSDAPGNSSYTCGGIDSEGNFFIVRSEIQKAVSMGVYGQKGVLLKKTELNPSSNCKAAPVADESGIFTHMASAYLSSSRSSSGKRNYYTYARVYALASDKSLSVQERSSSDYPSTDRILYTACLEGIVYVNTGAEYVYVWQSGTGIYEQRARSYQFDLEKGTTQIEKSFGLWTGFGNHGEYSRISEAFFAIQSSVGNPSYHNQKGSETMVVQKIKTLPVMQNQYRNKYFAPKQEDRIQVLVDLQNWQKQLSETFDQDEKQQGALQATASKGTQGSLSRTLGLQPATTYYYEYRQKGTREDSLVLEHQVQRKDQTLSEGKGYRVENSFSEDFNDSAVHPFFDVPEERIIQGRLRGGHSQGYGSSSKLYSDSSSLSFEIEPGKQGILSFDYHILRDREYELSNYVSIDGSPWLLHTQIENDKTLHYTHPYILSEGKHTLEIFAGGYGNKNSSSSTFIDNLRLDYIKSTDDVEKEGFLQKTENISPLEDGWYQVRGSFQTPFEVNGYESILGEYISGSPGSIPFASLDNSKTNRSYLDVALPPEKTAAYMAIGVSTSVGKDYSVTYRNPSRDESWRCYGDVSQHPFGIPKQYRILMPSEGVRDQVSLEVTYSQRRGTRGSFTGLELFLVDEMSQTLKERRFFIDKEQGKACGETQLYEGESRLSLLIPQDETVEFQDLRIYCIREGQTQEVLFLKMDEAEGLEGWETESLHVDYTFDSRQEEKPAIPVFQKGEMLVYDVSYYDHEEDPSKASFWEYVHQPLPGGELHPESGKILAEPIERFYLEGKYTLTHWQRDDTTRGKTEGGDPRYDKDSNRAVFTFYVQSQPSEGVPWIRYIRTNPAVVEKGKPYEILIRPDDEEKDPLALSVELYYEKERIKTLEKKDIRASGSGEYPEITMKDLPLPKEGLYTVICRISDQTGSSVKEAVFTVAASYTSSGMVHHTPVWDQNRKRYNLKRFGSTTDEIMAFSSYILKSHPRLRGLNVFWSGEAFVLSAQTDPQVQQVSVRIREYPSYQTFLEKGALSQEGARSWKGQLWESSMIDLWGKNEPELLTFVFTGIQGKQESVFAQIPIIMDTKDSYWQLHRLF